VLSFVGEVVPVEGAARAVGEEAQGSLSCPRRAYRLDSLTGSEETRVDVRGSNFGFWAVRAMEGRRVAISSSGKKSPAS
jgi:hypothetical protein